MVTAHDVAEALRYARDKGMFPDVNVNCDTTADDGPSDDDTVVIVDGKYTLTLEFTYNP